MPVAGTAPAQRFAPVYVLYERWDAYPHQAEALCSANTCSATRELSSAAGILQ
jgi:hypothetical protein